MHPTTSGPYPACLRRMKTIHAGLVLNSVIRRHKQCRDTCIISSGIRFHPVISMQVTSYQRKPLVFLKPN